jgi:hypothetical protein
MVKRRAAQIKNRAAVPTRGRRTPQNESPNTKDGDTCRASTPEPAGTGSAKRRVERGGGYLALVAVDLVAAGHVGAGGIGPQLPQDLPGGTELSPPLRLGHGPPDGAKDRGTGSRVESPAGAEPPPISSGAAPPESRARRQENQPALGAGEAKQAVSQLVRARVRRGGRA